MGAALSVTSTHRPEAEETSQSETWSGLELGFGLRFGFGFGFGLGLGLGFGLGFGFGFGLGLGIGARRADLVHEGEPVGLHARGVEEVVVLVVVPPGVRPGQIFGVNAYGQVPTAKCPAWFRVRVS